MNPLIYPELEAALKNRIGEIRSDSYLFPDKEWVRISEWYNKRHYNRWIQVYTPLPTEDIHYEYMADMHVCISKVFMPVKNIFGKSAN